MVKVNPKLLIAAVAFLTGCGPQDDRLARMATESAQRQAEQNRQMADLHKEIVEGTRQLVEADAKSREEMFTLQRDLLSERAEVDRQRDQLEADRQAIAARRRSDPIIAAAITHVGMVLACLLPLVLCWYLLKRGPGEERDVLVGELLIEDLVSETPVFLPRSDDRQRLVHETHEATDDFDEEPDAATPLLP